MRVRTHIHPALVRLLAVMLIACSATPVVMAPGTHIIKQAVDWTGDSGDRDKGLSAQQKADAAKTENELTKVVTEVGRPLFGIALAVAPLTIVAGAIAMQLGSQKGPRIMGVGLVGLAVVGSVTGIVA